MRCIDKERTSVNHFIYQKSLCYAWSVYTQPWKQSFKRLLLLPSDGSYQEITIVATNVGDWTHRNVSHVSRQEVNLTQSSVNGTWLPPADNFDPLGGHTVWQVNGSS